tara:strand:- start:217 stop:516 length:300 start_codon:yes stop_codon:yes gene_type:complete
VSLRGKRAVDSSEDGLEDPCTPYARRKRRATRRTCASSRATTAEEDESARRGAAVVAAIGTFECEVRSRTARCMALLEDVERKRAAGRAPFTPHCKSLQ